MKLIEFDLGDRFPKVSPIREDNLYIGHPSVTMAVLVNPDNVTNSLEKYFEIEVCRPTELKVYYGEICIKEAILYLLHKVPWGSRIASDGTHVLKKTPRDVYYLESNIGDKVKIKLSNQKIIRESFILSKFTMITDRGNKLHDYYNVVTQHYNNLVYMTNKCNSIIEDFESVFRDISWMAETVDELLKIDRIESIDISQDTTRLKLSVVFKKGLPQKLWRSDPKTGSTIPHTHEITIASKYKLRITHIPLNKVRWIYSKGVENRLENTSSRNRLHEFPHLHCPGGQGGSPCCVDSHKRILSNWMRSPSDFKRAVLSMMQYLQSYTPNDQWGSHWGEWVYTYVSYIKNIFNFYSDTQRALIAEFLDSQSDYLRWEEIKPKITNTVNSVKEKEGKNVKK